MAQIKMVNSVARDQHNDPARPIAPELQLRSLLAGLSRHERFGECGVELDARMAELVPKVAAEKVAVLAIEARQEMKQPHASLLIVREMARHKTHRVLVAETLERVIQRAEDLAEFVAIYWKDGRVPLSGQVKKAAAMVASRPGSLRPYACRHRGPLESGRCRGSAAFPKFGERDLAKYGDCGSIKLRDVLFLCHAKPRDAAQAGVWKKLIWGRLKA